MLEEAKSSTSRDSESGTNFVSDARLSNTHSRGSSNESEKPVSFLKDGSIFSSMASCKYFRDFPEDATFLRGDDLRALPINIA